MILVGLTGSVASGKSLVASFWKARGAVVVDADALGHQAIRKGGDAHEAVIRAFGPGILDAGGDIDRKKLGRRVFEDDAARRRLESIVHPRIIDGVARRAREAWEAGASVVVVDAALIFEAGLAGEFDAVVVVRTAESRQIAWLVERGLSPEAARQRIAAQWQAADKARRADFVIENDGTRQDLEREADKVWSGITALKGRPIEAIGLINRKDRKS